MPTNNKGVIAFLLGFVLAYKAWDFATHFAYWVLIVLAFLAGSAWHVFSVGA